MHRVLFIVLAGLQTSGHLSARDGITPLAQELVSIRGFVTLPDERFPKIQSELIAWVDARVHRGDNETAINAKLAASRLILTPKTTDDEIFPNYTGYLDLVSFRPIAGASDLFAVH